MLLLLWVFTEGSLRVCESGVLYAGEPFWSRLLLGVPDTVAEVFACGLLYVCPCVLLPVAALALEVEVLEVEVLEGVTFVADVTLDADVLLDTDAVLESPAVLDTAAVLPDCALGVLLLMPALSVPVLGLAPFHLSSCTG